MSRHGNKSHVFATKSIPKQPRASKQRKRNSPSAMTPTIQPSSYTIESNMNINNDMSTSSSSLPSSGSKTYPRSPTMAIVPSMSSQTPTVSADHDFASTIHTEGSPSDSICFSYFRRISDAPVTTQDIVDIADGDPYERDFPTFSEESIGN
jgi:hypothetical protein